MIILWRFNGFYANPDNELRVHSWNLLCRLAGGVSNDALLVGGDFNEILLDREKKGGRAKPLSQLLAFRDAIEACGLSEVRSVGSLFTWDNRRKGYDNVKEKPDRAFHHVLTRNLVSTNSDHYRILVELGEQWGRGYRKRKKRRFLFKEFWANQSV